MFGYALLNPRDMTWSASNWPPYYAHVLTHRLPDVVISHSTKDHDRWNPNQSRKVRRACVGTNEKRGFSNY